MGALLGVRGYILKGHISHGPDLPTRPMSGGSVWVWAFISRLYSFDMYYFFFIFAFDSR